MIVFGDEEDDTTRAARGGSSSKWALRVADDGVSKWILPEEAEDSMAENCLWENSMAEHSRPKDSTSKWALKMSKTQEMADAERRLPAELDDLSADDTGTKRALTTQSTSRALTTQSTSRALTTQSTQRALTTQSTKRALTAQSSEKPRLLTPQATRMLTTKEGRIHPCAICIFHFVFFFVQWFGANRFDYDGDGDFDAEDVQSILEDLSLLKKNFRTVKKEGPTTPGIEGLRRSMSTLVTPRTPRPITPTTEQQGTRPITPTTERQGTHPITPTIQSKEARGLEENDATAEGEVQNHESQNHVWAPDMHWLSEEMNDLEGGFGRAITGNLAVEDRFTSQPFPFYIVLQSVFALISWFAGSVYVALNAGDVGSVLTHKAGIDTISDGWSDLRLTDGHCGDLRPQVWRLLTYQWNHVGVVHIVANCLMNLILGIPLEGLHGHWRLLLMYNFGVLGGAFCYSVADAHKIVVGMSGGCYALIGMHISNIVMNWHQIKYRWLTVMFLFVLITVDLSCYFLTLGAEDASHTAHVGGFIAGALISTIIGENIKVHWWERIIQVVTVGTAICLVVWCTIHLIINEAPRSIFEDYGWCFVGQVYDPSRFGNVWQCVQCASKDCMQSIANAGPLVEVHPVSISECKSLVNDGA